MDWIAGNSLYKSCLGSILLRCQSLFLFENNCRKWVVSNADEFGHARPRKEVSGFTLIPNTQGNSNNQQCMQLIFTIHNIEFHTQREITRVYNSSQKSHIFSY
jgi:hypothetical protein